VTRYVLHLLDVWSMSLVVCTGRIGCGIVARRSYRILARVQNQRTQQSGTAYEIRLMRRRINMKTGSCHGHLRFMVEPHLQTLSTCHSNDLASTPVILIFRTRFLGFKPLRRSRFDTRPPFDLAIDLWLQTLRKSNTVISIARYKS
jgi:hypothetical protein